MGVVIAVLIVIALIATGLGLSFWAVVGILALLGVVFLVACSLMPDEKDSTEKAKKKKKISTILLISIPVVIIALILAAFISSCDMSSLDSSSEDAEYDEAMGSYDWGDDYYYDSNDNSVNKKAW